jgi:hypothetical protein
MVAGSSNVYVDVGVSQVSKSGDSNSMPSPASVGGGGGGGGISPPRTSTAE